MIREARHKKQISLSEVSKETGISVPDVSSMENGRMPTVIPSAGQITKLARILDLIPAAVAYHLCNDLEVRVNYILQAREQMGESEYNKMITCPKCGGKLQMIRAPYNGHVSGYCQTTQNCLGWME